MQETVKERLISYLKSIPMSQKAFCDKIGVSKGYITNMVSGFGRDVLFRIKSEFPDLSINWLLYGEGEMLNSQSQAVEVGGKQIPFFDVEFEGGYDVMALLQWYLKRYISQRFACFCFAEISKLVGENRAKLKQNGKILSKFSA